MRSPGINGEGELRGNRLTQVHLEKMAVKMECVYVCEPDTDQQKHTRLVDFTVSVSTMTTAGKGASLLFPSALQHQRQPECQIVLDIAAAARYGR